MIQIRLRPPCRREFDRSVYKPGVISLARLLWGSVGAGGALFCVAFLSHACGVEVLLAPLAATCFLNTTCVFLRVARPKQIIVGHFVATVCGLLAVVLVTAFISQPWLVLPLKLGLAVAFAAIFMQIFDADHPPAAATAAIPALLPLPVGQLFLPLHMAWGGVIAVLFSMLWSRPWFRYPPPDKHSAPLCLGLHMERSETLGVGLCAAAFVLMVLKPLSLWPYRGGLVIMLLGVAVLMVQHFLAVELIVQDTPDLKDAEVTITDETAPAAR